MDKAKTNIYNTYNHPITSIQYLLRTPTNQLRKTDFFFKGKNHEQLLHRRGYMKNEKPYKKKFNLPTY